MLSFLFKNKTLRLNNLKARTAMNSKISVLVTCVEAIMYLLLYKQTFSYSKSFIGFVKSIFFKDMKL